MFNGIGYSVYLSNFEQIEMQLASLYREGSCIFTSFHISEEYDRTYKKRAGRMCRSVRDMGYEIIADVSKQTLAMFDCRDITDFARRMGISILRMDYGFSEEEILEIGRWIPICLNASTVPLPMARRIAESGAEVYAIHNLYPRPETGLDEEFFDRINRGLREAGIKVFAFIPGDTVLRGPLFESLPTLEAHRKASPYASYVDMKTMHEVDGVFVGDGIISEREAQWIDRFAREQVVTLPINLVKKGEELYDRIFTIRADSPRWLKRLEELGEYSCFGEWIEPDNCTKRLRGSVTVDNIGYKHYSGEIQLMIEDLPADGRVNVLGRMDERYQPLLKSIRNGGRVLFVRHHSLLFTSIIKP